MLARAKPKLEQYQGPLDLDDLARVGFGVLSSFLFDTVVRFGINPRNENPKI
jgi:hypothetical protein